jgi:hypothetical protein
MFIDGSTCQTAPVEEAAPLCNNVQNAGSWVRAVLHPGDGAPVGPGGTLADGIYQATALDGYRGAADTEVRDTVAVTKGGTVILWASQAMNTSTGATTTTVGNLEHSTVSPSSQRHSPSSIARRATDSVCCCHIQTLNLKWMTSPSRTTYSLPSRASLALARHAASGPSLMRSSRLGP